MAKTFAESKCVFLAGPIEWWWPCPEEPDRFHSRDAIAYRNHRIELRDALVRRGYLVYSPHESFKGPWNEKMQLVNDFVLGKCDIVIDMSPPGIPGKGTEHEIALAKELGKDVFSIPPIPNIDMFLDAFFAVNNIT